MTLISDTTQSPIRPSTWTEDWLNLDFEEGHLVLRYERGAGTYITMTGLYESPTIPFFEIEPVKKLAIMKAGRGRDKPLFFAYSNKVYEGFEGSFPGIKNLSRGQKLSHIIINQDTKRFFDEVQFQFQEYSFAFGYDLGKLVGLELQRKGEEKVLLGIPGKDIRHKSADIGDLAVGVSEVHAFNKLQFPKDQRVLELSGYLSC